MSFPLARSPQCQSGFKAKCRRACTRVKAQKQQKDVESPNPGLGLKAVWVGAENFGKLIGLSKGDKKEKIEQKQRKMSRQEVIDSIRADYDVNYFVSGKGDMEAYDPDCLFADPFAGFNGVDRFKQNVSNLGGLLKDIELDMIKFEERESEVETKWRFSAILEIPWKPRLAAAGGTTHVLDQETGKVVKHIEAWDVEPSKVIQQLLKPASKSPSSNAEKFMLALSRGDTKGMWLTSATWFLFLAGPLFALTQLAHLSTGQPASGFLGAVNGVSVVLLAIAGSAQVYRLVIRQDD